MVNILCVNATDNAISQQYLEGGAWSFLKDSDIVEDNTGQKLVDRNLDSHLISGIGMEAVVGKVKKLGVRDNDKWMEKTDPSGRGF